MDFDSRRQAMNKQIAAEYLDLEQHCAYMEAVELDQVTYRKDKHGWMVLFKGRREGKAVVAFLGADCYAGAAEVAGEFAAKGILTWGRDKWPSQYTRKALSASKS